MNNTLFAWIVVLGVIVGGFLLFNTYNYEETQSPTDFKTVTFLMSGEPVTLVDGVAETETLMGAASKTVVRYFGNEVEGDINGDMIPDMAFLVTQETGGSGTFFYLVGAIQNEDGTYRGTDAVLIGDRIAPMATEYQSFSGIPGGYIIVNYAERAPGEPMTAQPSVGKSLWLKLDAQMMQFGELVQNFEGEVGATTTQQ